YLHRLAERFSVLAPSHPGFGSSDLPDWVDSAEDVVYVYLDLLRQRGRGNVMGMGIGGWFAAEMAVRCTQDIDKLVLVDPVGIKVGSYTERDIADNFMLDTQGFLKASWHDPEAGASVMKLPGPELPEEE